LQKASLSCVLALACTAGAAPPQADAVVEATPEPDRAEVTLDGVTLFHVRGIPTYPADKRARAIAERIRAIAADRSVPVDSLRIVEAEGRSNILAGERGIMSVVALDAESEGVPRDAMAQFFTKQIASAIAAYRSDRRSDVLLTHTLYAIGATLLLAGLLFALRRGYRWLNAAATRYLGSRIEALERKSGQMVHTDQLWHALRGSLLVPRILLTLALLYAYLYTVLGLYPWTRPAARGLFDLVMEPLRIMGSGVIREIPSLAFLAVLAVVTYYGLQLVRLFFAGIEKGRISFPGLDSELAEPTHRIVRLLIVVFALVVAFPYIPGSGSDAFKGISLFIGLVFSLGSTSFIGNLIAGYAMIYRRAFRIGDRIKVGEHVGTVMERKLMVTRLLSPKNEEIVIPNSEMLSSNIVNFSTLAKTQGVILHTTVGIGYGTPWRQVEAMLCMAAQRTPGLLATPEPFVLQKGLGDFSVSYEINAYCDQPQAMPKIYTALQQNILDVFNEYGVQIMTPGYEGDPEQPKVVPEARWFEAPAKPPPLK
jgi:small-conductance mechanosensitive channel